MDVKNDKMTFLNHDSPDNCTLSPQIMLPLTVAFAPLALYFFAVAALHSGRRARMLTGQEDFTAIALGLIGFVMIGPMMLFLPVDALAFWGFYTWFFLAVLYALFVWLLTASMRLKLVVYNIKPDELRAILNDVAAELDSEARWAGNSLALPTLGIQFYLEPFPMMRNVVLKATGPQQELKSWLRFEKSLAARLLKHRSEKSRISLIMALVGLLIGGIMAAIFFFHSQEVYAALRLLLDMP